VFALVGGGGVDKRCIEDEGVCEHKRRDDGVEQSQVVEHLQACQLPQRPVDRQTGVQLKHSTIQVVQQQPEIRTASFARKCQ